VGPPVDERNLQNRVIDTASIVSPWGRHAGLLCHFDPLCKYHAKIKQGISKIKTIKEKCDKLALFLSIWQMFDAQRQEI